MINDQMAIQSLDRIASNAVEHSKIGKMMLSTEKNHIFHNLKSVS
jgi:hypothetical protein